MAVNSAHSDNVRHDAQLVRRVLDSGDRKAYAELMNHYADQVYTQMLSMSGDALDAEDLTLEAFSKAFENLVQYNSKYAFSTWLFKIARNNCIDHLRRTKKDDSNPANQDGIVLEQHDATAEIPCQLPGPEQLLINRQETDLLRNVVKGLKPNYKAIIEMHYFKELSCEEIAEELNLPENTVKVRLFRARELLYNILIKK
jgi:RNA polymerase sigma factor (sigma-70 family)